MAEKEKLFIVDNRDKFLRYGLKHKIHQDRGILHRAFSVYIFNNKGELLIQKRSGHKLLWPLFWANSCCSHPRKGEDYIKAGERRIKEELGFSIFLAMVDKFIYRARFKNIGSEHEMCAVLTGFYSGKVKLNRREAVDYKWIKPENLLKDFKKRSGQYAPWLKIGLKRYLKIKKQKEKKQRELKKFLEQTAKKMEPVLKKLISSYVDKKFQPLAQYQIAAGGKRLRPALVIASAMLLGGKEKNVLFPAAGLELLHNSTLIVDDIIDHSQTRRNKPTVWFNFGQSAAECMGLDYLASAFLGSVRSNNPKDTAEVLGSASKIVVNGEIMDILFEQKGRDQEQYVVKNRYRNIKKKDYYAMVGRKTAALFRACCEIGGIGANGSRKQKELLKQYGYNFGLIFQIRDDFLDIFGEEKEFGKKIGKDIEERKLGNIVILLALKELSAVKRKKLLKIFKKGSINNKDIKSAVKLIETTKAREKVRNLAEGFGQKAKTALEKLPQNKWNRILESLIDFSLKRNK